MIYGAISSVPLWGYLLVLIYTILAILIVLSLLMNGVRPAKTLGWLLAIFTIPVGGVLLYWMLGRNRRNLKMSKLLNRELPYPSSSLDPEMFRKKGKYERIMRLLHKTNNIPPLPGNKVELLIGGEKTFQSIFRALEGAKESIFLQYYIFEEGQLADRLLDLFIRKSLQGVQVKLIYDEVGSYSLSRRYRRALRKAGVEVYPFLPFRFSRMLSSLNYRNHRKIISVDGRVAFTGGINISDKYLSGDDLLGPWHDAHLMIAGPAVASLEHVFARDWFMVSGNKLSVTNKPAVDPKPGNVLMHVVPSGPDNDFAVFEQLILRTTFEAKEYLYITNPYIIPTQEILKSLQVASLSGVDVRLLLSEQSDSKIVNWSVRSYFEPLMRAGVRIFLYPHGFLHSKIMVSDNDIASVGTANIDVRSFELNYEVNALIYDREFAMGLRMEFLKDCEVSRELIAENYYARSIGNKLKEGAARIFSPLL